MFHIIERIISLIRASTANRLELARVPVDGVGRCRKLSAPAAAVRYGHNLERGRALTSTRIVSRRL